MAKSARIAWIVIALSLFAAPGLPALGFGESIGARAVEGGIPPELPLGVFFAIWGVIFSAYLAQAVLANLWPRPVDDRLAVPLVLAGVGNLVWMVVAQGTGLVWLQFLVLLPTLALTWQAAYRLDRVGGFDGTIRRGLACLTVGLLAGWLTVAVSISVPDTVRWILGRGASDAVWQSLWMALVPAGGLAFLFASRISRSGWFFVALGWGLAGIVANNWYRTGTHGVAIAAFIVGAVVVGRRLRYGARGSMRWTGSTGL